MSDFEPTESGALETRFGRFRVQRFRQPTTGEPALALLRGEVAGPEALLARVHSACLTSEFLGALDCDCAEQLASALEAIAQTGRGALLYLMQEGRGAGLLAKARDRMMVQAHRERITTFDAFERMGLPLDRRSYAAVPELLAQLGISAPLRLLTQNPEKAHRLEAVGVRIDERIALPPLHTPWNAHYLASKAGRGHTLPGPTADGAVLPEPVAWFEPHALPELPRFLCAARYLMPVPRAGWLRALVFWDRTTSRERLLLEPLRAQPGRERPLCVVQPQSLLDRFPLEPIGATRRAWSHTEASFAAGRAGRALLLGPDEATPPDAETLRLLTLEAA
jgi:3,4-dihydroxy 2-butanone 4-phosphate synthase / GTP cyclohydrolase II